MYKEMQPSCSLAFLKCKLPQIKLIYKKIQPVLQRLLGLNRKYIPNLK